MTRLGDYGDRYPHIALDRTPSGILTMRLSINTREGVRVAGPVGVERVPPASAHWEEIRLPVGLPRSWASIPIEDRAAAAAVTWLDEHWRGEPFLPDELLAVA